MQYAIDVQGFRLSANLFVAKEFSATPILLTDVKPTTFVFKPLVKWSKLSYDEKKVNQWLQKKFHKIDYDYGQISGKDVFRTIQTHLKDAKTLFVKGASKMDFFSQFLINW